MSKYNTGSTGRFSGGTPNTVNRAGGAAYLVADEKKALASVVLSSMLNGDSYYQSDTSRQRQIFDLIASLEDKEFAAKAMVYTRQEGNLRSVSHLMANALVESASGAVFLRKAIKRAIVRPDDMTEMASLWFSRHQGKMLPNSMRRAFKDLLDAGKWDAYQLKKYLGNSKSVKLRDVIKLTHPVDEKGLYKKVIEGTLQAPATIEKMLASGQKASETFEQMLSENRLGYMAAVKNIRNALETGISDEALDMWVRLISDEKKVRRSRMLPFRFYDAWEAVRDLGIDHFKLAKVKAAFNDALIHSAYNLDFVARGEKVALILDESGSMGRVWKHAIILAAVLYHALGRDNVVVYKFAGDCKKVDFGNALPIDIIEKTRHGGGATLFHAPMKMLIDTNTKVNKLIVLTDMQLYQTASSWYSSNSESFDVYLNEYRRKVSPGVMTLFWDLQGYGAGTPVELKDNILLASGFSDKLLSVIPRLWKNENALVEEIEAITL